MTDIEGFLTIYGHSDNLLNNNMLYMSLYFTGEQNWPNIARWNRITLDLSYSRDG